MPYISTESVKEIRNELKSTFPNFKFSVRRDNHSSVIVTVLSGPIDFGGTDISVNQYWLADNWGHNPEALDFLTKLKSIIGREQRELVYDGDYGSVPNYWYSISIGRWDKPYTIKY
jgi:hypothetical protein